MRRSSLFLQIFVPFLGVILLALLAATWEASTSMHRFHLQQTQETLEVRARVFERQLADKMNEQQAAPLDALCKDLGKLSNTRVTVVLPSGKVIGDTEENPATMDNHADRPEIIEALAGRVGHARRYSHTLRANLIYVAVPVMKSGACLGIIRTSASLVSVDYALQQVLFRIMGGSIIIAVLAALVSLGLARRITRPLQQMIAGAERFAGGHLETHLPRPKSAELARLAETMNAMATQLNDRIQTVNRQRNELDSVLASMVEGVLAVDNQENIISMNRAAAALFGVSMESVRGRSFREVVRNLKLQECVTRMLSRYEPFEEEVELAIPEERCLRVSATGLRSEDGSDLGALLVMDDITELRMLERVRTDFVANVSHEIRTPVTSIKGYAETLLGEDQKDPETLKKFLEIIVRQADRLTALVEDILSLSALEQSEAKKDVVFEHVQLNAIIEESVYLCTPKALSKQLKIVVSCDENLAVHGNAPLLEQAITNLLDNAVKYSEPDHEIHIQALRKGNKAEILVRDFGAGIPSEHLPRIFERFYRVERARSRSMGGTGLGLAIVKHISGLHGGAVAVESALGKGSSFTILLPAIPL